ncbi:pentatricopeptide repeat-containing protein At1g02370, mitochondrial [Brassica napus]|uniref:pentatricopeptide repeat-containing protein At1g02370, mitochondrial n=1 Tax=Brassica napus TaxID=3708 RepID=UPI002079B838|nr:pentatricopeptide repeat-containing protein At1g02370, mitochondrial [Brassica napus]
MVVAPFSSYAAEFNPNRQITTPAFMLPSPAVAEKSSIFEKIQPFIGETLDFITREEEKKEDLVDWAKRLNKDGKFEYAFEIFEWMDKKKMEFSPSELAVYVDLIAQTKGIYAAEEYFNQVEPVFDRTNTRAKNWPAFASIVKQFLTTTGSVLEITSCSRSSSCAQRLGIMVRF